MLDRTKKRRRRIPTVNSIYLITILHQYMNLRLLNGLTLTKTKSN